MSKTKPTILASIATKADCSFDILQTEAIYGIYYCGEPFNSRKSEDILGTVRFLYNRAAYAQKGSALAAARKLNDLFNTDKFTVHVLCKGQQIT